jgi:hypothetical protein
MRLHFDFSEYDDDPEPSRVLLTVNLADGSPHGRVTEIYEKALSIFMGYDISTKSSTQFEFSFEDENECTKEFPGCENCVQGTCVFNCGKEFA